METSHGLNELGTTTKRFVRRLAMFGENRLELLTVEIQEELEKVLQAFLLALGMAIFSLLAGLTLTAAIAVLLWSYSPWAVLLIFFALYGTAGVYFYWRLGALLHNWQTLQASLDQIRKDRACLEKILA